MATAAVDFSDNVPMDLHSIADATTNRETGSTPEPESEPVKKVARLRDLKTSARDQLMIDPRIIVVEDGHNPRDYRLPENRAHLDSLKLSIKENGTLSPLLVRFDAAKGAAVLVDGECRLRANLELIAEGVEIDTVPTIQVTGGNEADRHLLAIAANQHKNLSKWELGTAFQRLYNFGWSPEKIAMKTGSAVRFVTEAMELADAPDEVKQLLSSQAVSPSLALAELRINGTAAVQTLQAKAVQAQNTGQKTAKRSKSTPPQRTAPAAAPKPSAEFIKALRAMLMDVPAADLNEIKNDVGEVMNQWVSVDRVKLLKLANFAI